MMRSLVPKLRFGEFSGEWEEKTFNDLTKISQGLQISISKRYTEKVDNSYFYITNEFLKKDSDKKYFIKNPPESVLCNTKDILMTRTGNTGQVVTNVNGAFHNNFFKIKYDERLNKDFLVYFLKSVETQNIIMNFAGASTIPDLNHGDFYRIKIQFPKEPKEQQKIANTLSSLDNLIEAQKKKVEALKKHKKGLMQQLFPREGEKKPKLRFEGFSGEWEEKAQGDCLDYIQPTKYLVSSTAYDDKYDTPVLTAGKTFILGYTDETHSVFSDNLPVIIFDDFTTATKFVNFPFKAKSSAMKILLAKEDINIKFMYESMQMIKYQVGNHERHWISIFSKLNVLIPKPKEQQKIANTLSSLDNLIEAQNKKIEALNKHKKGLMQQMFVSTEELT